MFFGMVGWERGDQLKEAGTTPEPAVIEAGCYDLALKTKSYPIDHA
jgi:hypothetical protein